MIDLLCPVILPTRKNGVSLQRYGFFDTYHPNELHRHRFTSVDTGSGTKRGVSVVGGSIFSGTTSATVKGFANSLCLRNPSTSPTSLSSFVTFRFFPSIPSSTSTSLPPGSPPSSSSEYPSSPSTAPTLLSTTVSTLTPSFLLTQNSRSCTPHNPFTSLTHNAYPSSSHSASPSIPAYTSSPSLVVRVEKWPRECR
ncbi:hypothetical protein BCR33DRAFT_521821 [Rhizoclosmatium globosum]|uniref:Uncharacterized protein n=1 Tax=Rhizoclosmatium globosum TaxID=329046 RepID=A0A1Y2BEU0_9FUNG|nr:hypothetical protein BCR33DRAFT_521821 [Rhizoclosmatium globosum]|eukprot:ORY33284.1 hypothetical protein BCR33DRAFT_521821 [Rhizoclosmatium globosum]